MKWNPEWGLRLAVLALAAGLLAWLAARTEWVDVREPVPLSKDMLADGTLAARHLLGRFGMRARLADEMPGLPPEGATLVLSAPYWDLVQGSPQALRGWVERGGHLVLDNRVLEAPSLAEWVGVRRQQPSDTVNMSTARTACRVLAQRAALPPIWGETRGFVLCAPLWGSLVQSDKQVHPLLWALDDEMKQVAAMRIGVGRGRVTLFNAGFDFHRQTSSPQLLNDGSERGLRNFSNRGLLEGDNAALLAALVDVHAGGEVWFVTQVQRPALPLWLWQNAAPVLVLAGLALLLALWRAAPRFGPLRADPPLVRRSLAAQIHGLADFLFMHQPAALHAATRRALEQAAAPRLPGWARLDAPARAQALAKLAELPADRLASALDNTPKRNAQTWSEALALLETARRTITETPPRRKPPR